MGILDGKTAIVTGAGRGIGRGHALLLAAEGATVVVNDTDATVAQDVVDEIAAAGGAACANDDDVASWDGAGRVVQRALESYGTLDVVVNNAGVLRDAMSFNITEAEWDAVITVHLKGHMAMSHHAVGHWRELGKAGRPVSGRIVNTASESGLFGQAGQINYATAKAGIVSMTLVLAREIVDDIEANAHGPGDRLPREEDMLARYEVARATLREALRFLELQGVIHLQPGRGGGPVVARPQTADFASSMALILQFMDTDLRSLLDLREAVAPAVAQRAAENATAADLAALEDCLAQLEREHEAPEFEETNRRFHDLLGWASGNPAFGLLVSALHLLTRNMSISLGYSAQERAAQIAQEPAAGWIYPGYHPDALGSPVRLKSMTPSRSMPLQRAAGPMMQ